MLAACSGYGSGRSIVRQSGSIVIGRRLTPLLPEDAHDAGPVAGADGSLLAADIRIDNRAELLRELGLAAAQGERLTDTALLMRCWERWREAMLDRVTGDYAFLLWDGPGQRLLLARDPMGQRPLCFHRAHGFVAVASMPRGLHALAEIPYALDEDALRTFLEYGEPDSSGTFFTGVKQVPPGHFLEIRPDRIDSRAFWSPDLTPIRYLRDEDYVERGRELLDAAVASRLRGAGHRVGAHLSAGLDSAGVAATAARLMNGQGTLFGFTAVPPPGYPKVAKNGRLLDEGPGAEPGTCAGALDDTLSARRSRARLPAVPAPSAEPLQSGLGRLHPG
jgi:asparagine synthase (glutamine-hydrolysing)